jgi:tRNA threonylcarbamoyladenosine biosynthesis protein TsaB
MKAKTTLIIDPREATTTKVTLIYQGRSYENVTESAKVHSQAILPLIEETLKKAHCTLRDIEAIEVLVDKGSYTGRRVGAAIATTVGTLLSIPVNGKPANQPVEIPYDTDKW